MMAAELMIRCDNPSCKSVGEPEWVDTRKRKPSPPTAPYGWFEGDGTYVGQGPHIHIYACSIDCVGPAVKALTEEAIEKEREKHGK